MSEECRLITKEQYDYYKSLEDKIDILVGAFVGIKMSIDMGYNKPEVIKETIIKTLEQIRKD